MPEAYAIAIDFKKYLEKKTKQVEIAGSLRRFKESIGDVDILAIANKGLADYFIKYKEVKKVLAKGPTKSSVMLNNGLQIDFKNNSKRIMGSSLKLFHRKQRA